MNDTTHKDAFGRPITVGCEVGYAGRRGSTTTLKRMLVSVLMPDGSIRGKDFDANPREVRLKNLNTACVINPPQQ